MGIHGEARTLQKIHKETHVGRYVVQKKQKNQSSGLAGSINFPPEDRESLGPERGTFSGKREALRREKWTQHALGLGKGGRGLLSDEVGSRYLEGEGESAATALRGQQRGAKGKKKQSAFSCKAGGQTSPHPPHGEEALPYYEKQHRTLRNLAGRLFSSPPAQKGKDPLEDEGGKRDQAGAVRPC